MDAKVVTAPTEGDWLLKNFGGVQISGPKGYAVATMWGALSIEKLNVRDHSNARLIVAACNSYQRHCPDPVSAAEEDLLGRCVEALREVRRENPMNMTGAISSETWAKIDDILSQVREVRG